jgi:hypothetical protein
LISVPKSSEGLEMEKSAKDKNLRNPEYNGN